MTLWHSQYILATDEEPKTDKDHQTQNKEGKKKKTHRHLTWSRQMGKKVQLSFLGARGDPPCLSTFHCVYSKY